ncbi:DNA (Cytosine-5)-methyltransferase DRM1/2 isoform 4 [Hibiscus syriacus]|uniref:DNA (Cytosine-5)-methyltransferase DRM1/2 isoform 4 n=1 Tax=Hibiscus syriacus TaxID=106335 RepID=A0A6A3BMS2_HIBSY|nr:DNA (Cytosine-5)-methyltransferase DRM1/2 isoform 4 [Hibiscus syriacus]
MDDFTDIDSSSDIEEIMNSDFDEESKLLYLTKMGFSEAEVSIAMERCGPDSSISELIDFICADQMAKVIDVLLMVEDMKPLCNDPNYKQRQNLGYDLWKRKKQRKLEKKLLNEDDHAVHLSIPMIGSGVPTESDQITQITLPEDAIGSPYFYYENVALAPNKVELFTNMYRKCQIDRNDLNKIVPLEPDEVEMILGFPKNHIRGAARDMFSSDINVLYLFSGISDAEVAFYCLGISLKTDVQELNDNQLEQLMSRFNGLDLVVGGIKRNNLTGKNKHHQDELEDFSVGAFSCNDCYDNSLFSCSNISHSFRIMERIQQSSEGHNEYHFDKESDRHRRSSNDVSRLELTPECR